jgi:ribonuclease P/MRP protein subunit POP3
LIGLLEGAPYSLPLLEYVRQHVAAVEVPWRGEAMAGNYLPLKVNVVETPEESARALLSVSPQPSRHSRANAF